MAGGLYAGILAQKQLPPEPQGPGLLEQLQASPHGILGEIMHRLGNGRIAQSLVSGATLPGDVYTGQQPLFDAQGNPDPTAVSRSMDTAGLATAGSLPMPRPSGGMVAGMGARFVDEHGAGGGARAVENEFATRYPETGPPTPALDMKKIDPATGQPGKPYLEKTLTPEAEAFQKARALVVKDMEKNGFKPHFDPAQRANVDPANYAEGGRTLVDSAMKKPETRAKYETAAMDPAGLERLQAAYDQGLKTKDQSGNWYHMKQLEDAFVKELGEKEGRKQFKERFAKAMATTTGGADPTSNLLMAHFGNFMANKGEAVPTNAYSLPFPIGGRYAGGNMRMFQKMLSKTIDAGNNPKRFNFMNNFLGHNRATIDEQMSNLFRKGMNEPDNYAAYEAALNHLAEKNGVDPRYFQEVAWAGGKNAKTKGGFAGKPMIQIVNEAVERTSRMTGVSPEEVVRRGLVRAEMPLYSGGPGGAIVGGAASTRERRK